MEGSVNTESIHSNIKENGVCNEIIITSVTSSMNSLDYNTTPIPPQKNTRLELPDDLTNEETAVDSYNTNANRDETDSHIDSLRVPASNIENTPLIGKDTGLFGYAPKCEISSFKILWCSLLSDLGLRHLMHLEPN